MFRFFDHTADLGIHVEAASLDEAFVEAARGLTAAMSENPARIQPLIEERIQLNADDLEFLLFDWLRELLLRFETQQMLFADFRVKVRDRSLEASLRGEPIDRRRHQLSHEVKAITYHGLRIEQKDGQWLAEYVVDI